MDMYFLPRDNKIYSFLVRRSQLYRYSLTILVVGLFICGWFFLLYLPSVTVLERYQAEVRQAKSKQSMIEQAALDHTQLSQRVSDMESFINHYATQSPATVFQSHIFFVVQQAAELGLTLSGASLEASHENEWYTKNGVSFELTGTIPQLIAWFDRIKNSKNMIRWNKLLLRKSDGNDFFCSCRLTFFAPKMSAKN